MRLGLGEIEAKTIVASDNKTLYTKNELDILLALHGEWVGNPEQGTPLQLTDAAINGHDFIGRDLSYADIRYCSFRNCRFDGSVLYGAFLMNSTFSNCIFNGAVMGRCSFASSTIHNCRFENVRAPGSNWANVTMVQTSMNDAVLTSSRPTDTSFTGASLDSVTFIGADLTGANFGDVTMRTVSFARANLNKVYVEGWQEINTDTSGATGLFDAHEWMKEHFKWDDLKGWTVYKAIGETEFGWPRYWASPSPGVILKENVDWNPTNTCGCGVNFGTRDFCERNYGHRRVQIWECHIPPMYACSIVVPFGSYGKARCGHLVLDEIVESS